MKTTTKIKNNIQIPEAFAVLQHRFANLNARLLAGANIDSADVSSIFKRQALQSCGCGKQLVINENNQMAKKFSCKKRFCRRCQRYMAFKRDMAFYPSVLKIIADHKRDKKNYPSLWFVTLTLPTCEAGELKTRLAHLQKEWRVMYNELKKKNSKGYVSGLRKLEINPRKKADVKRAKNAQDFKYHAHLHVLIQGKGNADYLKRKWLMRHPEASKNAQDVRRFEFENNTLAELLKYLAKPSAKGEGLVPSAPTAQALGYIYDQLRGRRTIFSYGKVKQASGFEIGIDGEGNTYLKHSDEYAQAYDQAPPEMQQKILRYLDNHKAKASRNLARTVWEFVDGNYVNMDDGDFLCEESDVRAAANTQKLQQNYETEKKIRHQNTASVSAGLAQIESAKQRRIGERRGYEWLEKINYNDVKNQVENIKEDWRFKNNLPEEEI
jgi:hypothetical protein